MKVELPPPHIAVHRGAPIEIGNVYVNNNNPASRNYRIVIGFAGRPGGRKPWNYIILIHVDASGEVVGCSRESMHIQNNWDLIGKVSQMPTMKIEWIKDAPIPKRQRK